MEVKSTRLRYISSPSSEGLTTVLSQLPFKVEIKSINLKGNQWYCWFVIPDVIGDDRFASSVDASAKQMKQRIDFPNINLEDF